MALQAVVGTRAGDADPGDEAAVAVRKPDTERALQLGERVLAERRRQPEVGRVREQRGRVVAEVGELAGEAIEVAASSGEVARSGS